MKWTKRKRKLNFYESLHVYTDVWTNAGYRKTRIILTDIDAKKVIMWTKYEKTRLTMATG